MADVEIKGRITVDAGSAVKSTNDYVKAVKDAQKAVNEAKHGTVEYEAAQRRLSKATNELNEVSGQSAGKFSKLKETLSGTVPGFQMASDGAAGFGKQLWALAANPIGAIIAAIVLAVVALKAAFTSSEEGQQKYAKLMLVISTIIDNLIDVLATLGEKLIEVFEKPGEAAKSFGEMIKQNIVNRFIGMLDLFPAIGRAIKLVFEGQFTKAGEVATNAITKITLGVDNLTGKLREAETALAEFSKQTMKDAELAAKVADMRAKADVLEGDLSVERAKKEAHIAELKLKSREIDDYTAQQRKQFLLEAQKIEDQLLVKEIRVATLRNDAQKLYNTFSKTTAEERDAADAAEAAVYRIQATRLNAQRSTQRELNRLNKEIAANEKEALEEVNKARIEAAKTAQQELIDIQNTGLDLAKLDDAERDRLSQKEMQRGSSMVAGFKANEDEKRKEEEKTLKHKEEVHAATEGLVANSMVVFGKQTMLGKGLAMAQALMNTYSGATDALRAKSVLASPFDVIAKVANVAAVISLGLKSVKSISGVNVPGGGGGGSIPSAPSISAPAPLRPERSSTALDQSAIQGIGNAAQGGVNRSFILEADITKNRERAERINRASRLS